MSTAEAERSVLRNHDFVLLLVARAAAMIAQQMLAVTVAWQVYESTGQPLDLGLIGLALLIPAVLLSPITGTVADRVDRRRIITLCYLVSGLSAVLLMLAAGGPHGILAVLVLLGSARAFAFPAQQALAPNLVPMAQLRQAIAWGSSTNQLASITGPALGGILISLIGGERVYALSAGLLVMASLCMAGIRTAPGRPNSLVPVTLDSVLAGLRFIRSEPAILGALSLDLVAVLLGGATAMLPIYARDILVIGPRGLGALSAAPSIGAVVVALALARRPLGRNAGRTMLVCVGIFGLATLVFALSTNFLLSLAALVVLGAADMCSVFVRQTVVQIGTPDHMRGRVSAVNALFINTSNQLGEFESGITAAWFGVVPAVVLGGIGTLLATLIWWRCFPALARIDLSPKR